MWKLYQDNSRVKRNIKIALCAIILLCALLLIGRFIGFIVSLNTPFTKSLASEKSRVWDGKTSYNLVYASKKDDKNLSHISLINFNPSEEKLTILHLSDSIYSELPRNFGFWRVGSIYPLALESGLKDPSLLLKLSVSKILAMPVDGVFVSNNDLGDSEKVWTTFLKNPLNLSSALNQAQTDLTPWEFFRLLNFAQRVRLDKVISLDLSQSSITESKLLPDSTRVLGVNYVTLDSFVRENLVDTLIYEENTTVAVFNATDHVGLAQEVTRVITNLGANVVFVSNTETKSDKNLVINSSAEVNSATFSRLASIYAPKCLKENCQINDSRVSSSRAQINLVIGEEYYNYWNKK